MGDIKKLMVEDFEDKIDTIFTLDADMGDQPNIEFKLVECTRRPPQNFKGRFREPFNILFDGPRAPVLLQGTYALQHDSFDESVIIFMVPIGQTDSATQYQAVFN